MIRNKRLKLAVGLFLGSALLTLAGGLLYLESESFADAVKQMISERSPQKLGIVGNFSNLKLYFFPPAIGVANPSIQIKKENVTQLPLEASIEAKELRVSFAPIQMFSGVLQVSEVEVNGGAIQGKLFSEVFKKQPKTKKTSTKLSWQDLFQLQINGVHFIDTFLHLDVEMPGEKSGDLQTEFVVKDLRLAKAKIAKKEGFISEAEVNAVRLVTPPKWKPFPINQAHQLKWNIEFTDEGLKLNPFEADLAGVNLKLVGALDGNLLDENSDPSLRARAEATSDLGTFFFVQREDPDWNGSAKFDGQVSGKLKNLEKTLKAKFNFQGQDLNWKDVYATGFKGVGGIDLLKNELEIDVLEATDDNLLSGVGKLGVSRLKLPLKFDQPFDADLSFENADLHWLGAVVKKAIYPLDARISGKVRANFIPHPSKWHLKAETDLSIARFALTNQKLGEQRVKKYILKPPAPLLIRGGLDIGSNGLDFRSLSVATGKSKFDVTGGIHGSKDFDFSASGPVDFKDVNEIAGSPIRGVGTLLAHIHGTADNLLLDFDPNVTDAQYLDLNLGKLTGRVTYDDGISELRFTGLRANYKNTFYSLKEGAIDLAGSDALRLPIDVNSGRVQDLSEMLASLVSKVSWYPKALVGEVHGQIDISGKLDFDKMIIAAKLEGADWAWMGEKARRVRMSLGYDQGVYYAKEASFLKSNGSIVGEIQFNSMTDEMSWNLGTENFSLNDLDFIERLEIPARSRLTLKSVGSGKINYLKSESEGVMFETDIKGERFQSSELKVSVGENTLRSNIQVFGGQMTGQLKYAMTPKQPSSLVLDLNRLDFSPTLLILNPKLLDDPELQGLISGRLQLDFLSTQSELSRGEFRLDEYLLKKNGFSLQLKEPVIVPIQLGYFEFKPTDFISNGSKITLQGNGKRGEVDLRLQGETNLKIAEFFTSSIQSLRGTADTDIRFTGPFKALRVDGEIDFASAQMFMRWMQSPIEEMDGSILIRQGTIFLDSLDAFLGEEVFSMNGKIETFTDRFPEISLKGKFDNNKIKMAPFDLVQPRGVLSISGSAPPYQISGNLDVSQALWTRSFSDKGSGATGSKGDRFQPKERGQSNSSLFALDMNVSAPSMFFIKNEIIDAEFRGRVKLIGSPESPNLLGEGTLVQGKVNFKDRPFVFDSVKVEFDDPYQFNPKFTASAVSEVNQYKVRVLATGRSSQWKAEFSSTPFLPENEIFSLLSAGTVASNEGRFRNRDRSLVNQGEAASLLLNSMDFSQDVKSKTGFQFDVQEAVDNQTANSIFLPQNLADNVAAPKVVLKRQVGRNVSFSFGSTVGVGSRSLREVNAEYRLSPGVSALGVWNNIEGVNTRESRTSLGMDLKFNQKFK